MKRIYRVLVILPMVVLGAAAQDDVSTQPIKLQMQTAQLELQSLQDNVKQAKVIAIGGAVMGPAVKNAPYSAVEVTESTQTLADGNRIHRESQTSVYRDSEGRVRRETPDQVTIWDPVANTSYFLDPKAQTARKMPLAMKFTTATGPVGGALRVMSFNAGPGQPFETAALPALPPPGDMGFQVMGARMGMTTNAERLAANTESLGKQTIEGLNAEGTRTTSTLEAGAIGNDRPIQITSESWYSSDLQTMVKSVHSDPRMGQDTFRLTNVSRVEPPSTLFQVPADYQILDRK